MSGKNSWTGELIRKDGACPNTLEIHYRLLNRDRLTSSGSLYADKEKFLEPKWIEHPRLGARADIAALPLAGLAPIYPYDPFNPGPGMFLKPTDMVSVVGYPFGVSNDGLALWSTGFIASEPEIDHDSLPLFLIDCRARKGQSGSPVIAYRTGAFLSGPSVTMHLDGPACRLLGIYSGRINEESDLGFVWKTSAIAELVATI